MKNISIIFPALLLLALTGSSCSRATLNMYGSRSTGVSAAEKWTNRESGKEVVWVGMVHLAKPSYYRANRIYLDSLKNEGYVVFYEGVGYGPEQPRPDSLTADTIARKLRKVIGFHLSRYDDPHNKSIPKRIQRLAVSGKYAHQSREILGLTDGREIRVDLSPEQMVREYETHKGEIVLTANDWRTGLNEKHKRDRREDRTRYSKWHMIHSVREKYISEAVINSDCDRIILLYGAGHYWFLLGDLQKQGFLRPKAELYRMRKRLMAQRNAPDRDEQEIKRERRRLTEARKEYKQTKRDHKRLARRIYHRAKAELEQEK